MKLRIPLFFGLALLLAALLGHADPAAYFAKEIHGQVVDDVSGEPLEGVIIVAKWELVREVIPFVINKSYGETIKIIEVKSDKEGKYLIPGWGPVLRPLLLHLEDDDPEIYYFRPGYYPLSVSNEARSQYSRDAVRTSQWAGKTIRLRKFTGQPQEYVFQNGRFKVDVRTDGTLKEYALKVQGIQGGLAWDKKDKSWQSMPRFIVAMKHECDRLRSLMSKRECPIDDIKHLWGGEKTVNEFIKEYEK